VHLAGKVEGSTTDSAARRKDVEQHLPHRQDHTRRRGGLVVGFAWCCHGITLSVPIDPGPDRSISLAVGNSKENVKDRREGSNLASAL
jgi:hypothetical protein